LRPMLTTFNGDPVAGGTFPALIWKAFMERANRILHDEPAYFRPAPSVYDVARRVVTRAGSLELDNGFCRGAIQVMFLSGTAGPSRTANCKPHEVDVPHVVGERLADARLRLARQPLGAQAIYAPAGA